MKQYARFHFFRLGGQHPPAIFCRSPSSSHGTLLSLSNKFDTLVREGHVEFELLTAVDDENILGKHGFENGLGSISFFLPAFSSETKDMTAWHHGL